MNRYVAVPGDLIVDGLIPLQASQLAKMFSLEMRVVDSCKEISVVAEPSVQQIDYEKVYQDGRIWSLDITDEFVDMTNGCYLIIDNTLFGPKIREKHCCRFRIRLNGKDTKNVELFVNNIKINEFSVTVKT